MKIYLGQDIWFTTESNSFGFGQVRSVSFSSHDDQVLIKVRTTIGEIVYINDKQVFETEEDAISHIVEKTRGGFFIDDLKHISSRIGWDGGL